MPDRKTTKITGSVAAEKAATPAKTARKPRQESSVNTPDARRPYHHGALPEALLHAAETVLQRDGLRGLTLRAIAREAGVSHTAPKHHFGDSAGVLTELAASGHWRLAMEMAAQARMLPPGRERRRAIAQGYVRFAAQHPDLFRLMARHELLNFARPAMIQAQRVSARALLGIFEEQPGDQADAYAGINAEQAVDVSAAWSYMHGLAILLVDGQLQRIASAGGFADAATLVEATLDRVQLVQDAA